MNLNFSKLIKHRRNFLTEIKDLRKLTMYSQSEKYLRHASDVPNTHISGIFAVSSLNKRHNSNSNVQDQYGCFIHNKASKLIKYI